MRQLIKKIKRFVGMVGSPLAHENEAFPAAVQTPPPGGVRIAFLPEKPVTEKEWKEMEDQGIVKRAPSPTHFEPQREGAMFAEVANPEKKKRGRPPKYATEADRKAADAARKRGDRAETNEAERTKEIVSSLPSVFHTGKEDALKHAGQGGMKNEDLERIAQGTSAALNAPDPFIADTVEGTADNLLGPTSSVTQSEHIKDRKHAAVPIHPDVDTTEKVEFDGTFVYRAFARQAASIRAWIKRGSGQCVIKPCKQDHGHMRDAALRDRDSKPGEEVFCASCGETLIEAPDTNGISRTPGNSRPETPPAPASS
jgi:hypothetical protein